MLETQNLSEPELNIGERAIKNAPNLKLKNGQNCIPQHYLTYEHTRETVEALIKDISYSTHYPIFISHDKGGLFLQIGIIGYDNYKSTQSQHGQKIVFGRKWRIEPNLPTSEIIQTAFLAIKKAREHEIRELFVIRREARNATPFSNHHDLPLMERNHDLLENSDTEIANADLRSAVKHVSFDGGQFEVEDIETLRSGLTIVTLKYTANANKNSASFIEGTVTLPLKQINANALYHSLMKELIAISDSHVDETFAYKGFKRFSAQLEVAAIADLSIDVRQAPKALLKTDGDNYEFSKRFETERYDTDLTRVPQLTQSPYSKTLYSYLSRMKLTNFDMLIKAQTQG
ncbi:MAG: hypothetical protein ABJ275_07360 [Maricaulaceae bacterium]